LNERWLCSERLRRGGSLGLLDWLMGARRRGLDRIDAETVLLKVFYKDNVGDKT
jgi:hypothetical protein